MLSEAGYDLIKPQGAFYLFPKAPGGDDVAFIARLKQENILAVPGCGFGRPGHFRLAFCVSEQVSWQGLAPGDQEVNTRLHQRLAPLIEQDLALYLQSLRSEWVAHAARLKAAGWRKAQAT